MHDEDEDRFLGGPLDHVARWMLYFIASCLMIAIVMAGWLTFANAHEAMPTGSQPLGWQYPSRCCWSAANAPAGRLGDCADIPDHAVKVGPDGYVVTLEPGDHPMVMERISYVIPYAETEQSPDGRYHLCISLTMKRRCFFAGARMG